MIPTLFQFYHCCDVGAWSTYVLCIIPYHILSYGDFLLSMASFWVTMLAMAELPESLHTLILVVGFVGLPIGTEWNKSQIWLNVSPMIVGGAIVAVSWVNRWNAEQFLVEHEQWF